MSKSKEFNGYEVLRNFILSKTTKKFRNQIIKIKASKGIKPVTGEELFDLILETEFHLEYFSISEELYTFVMLNTGSEFHKFTKDITNL